MHVECVSHVHNYDCVYVNGKGERERGKERKSERDCEGIYMYMYKCTVIHFCSY